MEDAKVLSQLQVVIRSVGDEVPLLPGAGNALAASLHRCRYLAGGLRLPDRDSSVNDFCRVRGGKILITAPE